MTEDRPVELTTTRHAQLLSWFTIMAWLGLALLLQYLAVAWFIPWLLWLPALLLIWGTFLLILWLTLWRVVRARSRLGPVLMLSLTLSSGLVFWAYGFRLTSLVRFYALKTRYEALVAEINAGRNPPASIQYRVESGPPSRVVFPWEGGVLDNWIGVVYDPSGLVLKARGIHPDLSNLHDPKLSDVTSLFGGDLYRCEPLGGAWYLCFFT